jgi:hypothetical protein
MDTTDIHKKYIYFLLEDNNYHKENSFLMEQFNNNSEFYPVLYYLADLLDKQGEFINLESAILCLAMDFYNFYYEFVVRIEELNKAKDQNFLSSFLHRTEYDYNLKSTKQDALFIFFIESILSGKPIYKEFKSKFCYRDHGAEPMENLFVDIWITLKYLDW